MDEVNVVIDQAPVDVVIAPQTPVEISVSPQGEIDVQVVQPAIDVAVVPPAQIGVSVAPAEPVVVTLYQGIPGRDGASSAGEVTTVTNFAFGDASPAVLGLVSAGKQIFDVEVNIVAPFDGVGSALTVGDSVASNRLMAAGQNDPATAGRYNAAPEYVYPGTAQLLLYITPGEGATTGSGTVAIRVQT